MALTGVLFVFLAISPVLCGQALRISSAATRQGERVAIEFSVILPKGHEPQVLQWETTIPTGQLRFIKDEPQAGQAARAADKSVTCELWRRL